MPKGTKVARCVAQVKKEFPKKSGAPYAICQKSTGQSYATGKKLNNSKRRAKK